MTKTLPFLKLNSAMVLVLLSLLLSGRSRSQSDIPPEGRLSFEQPDFPDNGAPVGRRRGGTSRNDCRKILGFE